MQKVKIGIVSTSQLSFPGDKAASFKKCINGLEELSDKLDFDLYIYPDPVIVREDAVAAVNAMESEKVDFLLVQHTSYSAGQLAPVFAKTKNAYVGFWAIPEGDPIDGAVPFNSFCSINMHMGIVAHYLKDYKIRIKWFYGYPDHKEFVRRLEVTVRALTAIKNIRKARIGLVGGIAPGFNDLYDDERNINKLFEGIYFNRLHEYSELNSRAKSVSADRVNLLAENIFSSSKGFSDLAAQRALETNARFYQAYHDFIKENQYDAVAISCWPKFQDEYKYSVCSVLGQLNDEGTVAACEGDVLSAISMLVLKYIAGNKPAMLMDMIEFDESDNTVLMWHCGPGPAYYSQKNGYLLGCNYSGMAHEPNKGVTSRTGVTRNMIFDETPVTMMRITGECDKMFQMGGEFVNPDKASFHGSRSWCGNLTFNGETISAKDLVNTILVNGFQHHFPIIGGNYTEELKEFAAWLGLNLLKKVPYADSLQIID